MALEEITGENWRSFTESPLAVLVIGKTDCPNCATWTEELVSFLADDSEFGDVRFGKVLLDQRGLADFKKNNSWLADLDVLPFNVIYANGEKKKDFAGGGIDRLTNRLSRLKS